MKQIFKSTHIYVAIALLAFLGALFVVLPGCNSTTKKVEENTLKIACNLPLTGDVAIWGESVKDGINMALKDLKDSLTKNSVDLQFDFQDNQGLPKNAVTIFQKQTMNPVDIYLSGITAHTMAIIDKVKEKKLTHFIYAFTPLRLTKGDKNFRTFLNFGVESDYYKKFIDYKKPKKVAILYVNVIGAKMQFEDEIIPYLNQKGVSEGNIFKEVYDFGKVDFKNTAAKIKAFNPDIILIEGFKENFVGLIKDFNTYSLFKDGNTMMAFDLLDANEDLPGELTNGLYVTVPKFLYDYSDQEYNKWVTKFKGLYNRNPRYTDVYAYDMTYILYNAVKTMRSDKITFDEAIFKTNFKGISGMLTFNENGELNYTLSICQLKDKKLIPVSF